MLAILLMLAAPITATADAKPVDNAWSILENGVTNQSSDKRAKGVHALRLLPESEKARQMAEKALSDQNADVRVEAANSLGQMRATRARAKLKETLNDKDVKVVIAAANALYLMKDPAAYDVYYALLTGERKGSAGLVQSELNTLKDRKGLEALAFETGIGFVPFGSMSYQAWKTVTHDGDSPVRAAAAEKLATDPDPMTTRALESSCSDKKWRVRDAVVDAIAKRGDPALLKSVAPLLWDDNDTVMYDAAATVVHLSARSRVKRGAVHGSATQQVVRH